MQVFRADQSERQRDEAKVWYAMPWHVMAKVENCRLENLAGDMRRTVYATGHPDTFFSIPAVCKVAGCRVRGYLTGDGDGNIVFRHCYY